jgi:hypothetical protein
MVVLKPLFIGYITFPTYIGRKTPSEHLLSKANPKSKSKSNPSAVEVSLEDIQRTTPYKAGGA